MVTLTRNIHLQKYRERWKRILAELCGDHFEKPDSETLEWINLMFDPIVSSFKSLRETMPLSVSKDGTQTKRHNFLSYNYVITKLLEARGIYNFHWEFPLPRSHVKLHALDDIYSDICQRLGIYFERSVVFKRAKCRKK